MPGPSRARTGSRGRPPCFEPGGAAQLHDGHHVASPQSTTVPNHADHADHATYDSPGVDAVAPRRPHEPDVPCRGQTQARRQTYTGMVITEEMVKAALQVVVLDTLVPGGAAAPPLTGSARACPSPSAASTATPRSSRLPKVIADLVVDTGSSFILDLSRAGSRRTRPFHARGSAAHPG